MDDIESFSITGISDREVSMPWLRIDGSGGGRKFAVMDASV